MGKKDSKKRARLDEDDGDTEIDVELLEEIKALQAIKSKKYEEVTEGEPRSIASNYNKDALLTFVDQFETSKLLFIERFPLKIVIFCSILSFKVLCKTEWTFAHFQLKFQTKTTICNAR